MSFPVNLLALDTSTSRAAIALGRGDEMFLAAPGEPGSRHGRGLIPAVRDLLDQAGLTLAELEAIAVGLGPGSFTGLRVGVMAAKTLAYARSLPLIGLDTLEILARNAPADELAIAVAVDAQRGDVSTAEFRRDQPCAPLLRQGPTILEPATSWLDRLPAGTLVLGPDLNRLAAKIPAHLRRGDPEWDLPQGTSLVNLARELWVNGRREDLWTMEPVYSRQSAAEEKRVTLPMTGSPPTHGR